MRSRHKAWPRSYPHVYKTRVNPPMQTQSNRMRCDTIRHDPSPISSPGVDYAATRLLLLEHLLAHVVHHHALVLSTDTGRGCRIEEAI